MTKVEITIQNGKVTWIEQSGEELPQELWNDFNVAIRSAVERYLTDWTMTLIELLKQVRGIESRMLTTEGIPL